MKPPSLELNLPVVILIVNIMAYRNNSPKDSNMTGELPLILGPRQLIKAKRLNNIIPIKLNERIMIEVIGFPVKFDET